MPTRILRDWTDSEAFESLDWRDEVLFTRLIMKADDFGRFTANPRLLRSLCFPLKDGIREADISRSLAACQKAGLIALYQVADKPLLEIVKFNQRLRAKVSRYPANDGHMSDDCPSGVSMSPPESESESESETLKSCTSAMPPRKKLSDDEFIQRLRDSPAYKGIDVDAELAKMDLWLLTPKGRGRKRSHQFILNWLNKNDRPVVSSAPSSEKVGKWKADADEVIYQLTQRPWGEQTKTELRKCREAIYAHADVAKPWLASQLTPEHRTKLAEAWKEES